MFLLLCSSFCDCQNQTKRAEQIRDYMADYQDKHTVHQTGRIM